MPMPSAYCAQLTRDLLAIAKFELFVVFDMSAKRRPKPQYGDIAALFAKQQKKASTNVKR